MKTTINDISRKDFLRILGIASASFGAFGLTGCGTEPVNNLLNFYGTPTLDIVDSWKQLTKDLGINMHFVNNNNDIGPIIANMIDGKAAFDYDLGGFQSGAERELAAAGKILPWDTSKIPNWEKTWNWVKDLPAGVVNGRRFGLPTVLNADSMIYLPDKIGGTVDSYSFLFDPKFKGKTAMEDSWINSVIFTAMYLKNNNITPISVPGDLTESELGTVMEFLIKKKKEKQFKTFWNTWDQAKDLIISGEVWVMSGWEPITQAAKDAGVNAMYAKPREGYEGWTNNLVIHAGAAERNMVEKIHQFANWELSGYYGCELQVQKSYTVPNDNSVAYAANHKEFDAKMQQGRVAELKDRFTNSKVYWQNTRPKNYKLYEEWWSKLRNA